MAQFAVEAKTRFYERLIRRVERNILGTRWTKDDFLPKGDRVKSADEVLFPLSVLINGRVQEFAKQALFARESQGEEAAEGGSNTEQKPLAPSDMPEDVRRLIQMFPPPPALEPKK